MNDQRLMITAVVLVLGTAAYKKELMPHAIILAILSMVTGTGWGMLTIYLFGLL